MTSDDAGDAGNPAAATIQDLELAARLLRNGGVVAIPTDTLYGLAADVFNAEAIERVFAIKERPEGLALPVLLSGWEQLSLVAREVPDAARVLAAAHWPGPLTLVLRRSDALPPRLTAGGDTVAVRVPGHPAPRELARRLGRPVTGTSANISGAPDPQSLEELRQQVGGRVDAVVSVAPAPAGAASTIVDLTGVDLTGVDTEGIGGGVRLIREGAIPFPAIAALLHTR